MGEASVGINPGLGRKTMMYRAPGIPGVLTKERTVAKDYTIPGVEPF